MAELPLPGSPASTTRARRRYHHGRLREALLTETLRRVREGGSSAVSLREVARAAGVSHAAAYRHFEGRPGLLRAIAAEGLRELCARLRAVEGEWADPVERLPALGAAYVRFAVARPAHFRVMFCPELARKEGELRGLADEASGPVVRAAAACEEAGILPRPATPGGHAVALWSLVHGIAALALDGQFEEGPLRLPAGGGSDDGLAEFASEAARRYVEGGRG